MKMGGGKARKVKKGMKQEGIEKKVGRENINIPFH